MSTIQRERYVPAFILLILAEESWYGLEIMHKIDQLTPGNRLDTAILYRSLKKLEEEKKV